MAVYQPRGLANELFRLIAEEAGPQVITQALPASKFIYNMFMPFVYESPPPSALKTLALLDKERKPLRQSHPAAFVKRLSISGKGWNADELKTAIQHALQNIELHNPDCRLQSFSVACANYALPIVLPCAANSLLSLKELELYISYPTLCTRACVSLVTSLFALGLEKVTLALPRAFSLPRFATIATLLKSLCDIASQSLTQLEFHVPSLQGNSDLHSKLPALLSDVTFVFPHLKKLVYIAEGHYFSLVPFLQRHPLITELRYFVNCPPDISSLLEERHLLPNLSRLHTYIHDALCFTEIEHTAKSVPHQLVALQVKLSKFSNSVDPGLNKLQKHLMLIETLRYLCIDDPLLFGGFSYQTAVAFIQACPRLIEFKIFGKAEWFLHKSQEITGILTTCINSLHELCFLSIRTEWYIYDVAERFERAIQAAKPTFIFHSNRRVHIQAVRTFDEGEPHELDSAAGTRASSLNHGVLDYDLCIF
ncbi:hypothetical protein BDP27DRAFT_1429168 [Rhodocollybia butyracea]|uniref:Uncharacterized protein n=1 Tax=Rhodocollybia butyracea TaxID=206335 RepID=A0A9P5PDE3_9AGAR|nr:hypothetical protein BDP27DRAFT_1429168 [Rhodocollybia butyracea]